MGLRVGDVNGAASQFFQSFSGKILLKTACRDDGTTYIGRPWIAGWSSLVARQAHNLKAAGSNPAPATNFSTNSSLLPIRSLPEPEKALRFGCGVECVRAVGVYVRKGPSDVRCGL